MGSSETSKDTERCDVPLNVNATPTLVSVVDETVRRLAQREPEGGHTRGAFVRRAIRHYLVSLGVRA